MKLFISYAHADKPIVQLEIVKLLSDAQHDVWYDHNLLPGETWEEEINRELKSADIFIAVLSPDSVASKWCNYELTLAINLRKPIIPILLRKTPIPDSITSIQYVDFSQNKDKDEAKAKLLGGLNPLFLKSPGQYSNDNDTKRRRLEAAMPQKIASKVKTELWVKIPLEHSEGLKSQLPTRVSFGDLIRKRDIRSDSFPITFKRDPDNRNLLPLTVCLEAISDEFDITSILGEEPECAGSQVPLELHPDFDTRTVIFQLTPKENIRFGKAYVNIVLYKDGRTVANVSATTEVVRKLQEKVFPVWRLFVAPLFIVLNMPTPALGQAVPIANDGMLPLPPFPTEPSPHEIKTYSKPSDNKSAGILFESVLVTSVVIFTAFILMLASSSTQNFAPAIPTPSPTSSPTATIIPPPSPTPVEMLNTSAKVNIGCNNILPNQINFISGRKYWLTQVEQNGNYTLQAKIHSDTKSDFSILFSLNSRNIFAFETNYSGNFVDISASFVDALGLPSTLPTEENTLITFIDEELVINTLVMDGNYSFAVNDKILDGGFEFLPRGGDLFMQLSYTNRSSSDSSVQISDILFCSYE